MKELVGAIAARLPHQIHDWLYGLTGWLLVEVYDTKTGGHLRYEWGRLGEDARAHWAYGSGPDTLARDDDL